MTEAKAAGGLYAALARVQADLPAVAKNETADTGSYKYEYAGLDAVTAAIMPVLGRHGLAFTAKPTLNSDGRFVLRYVLGHGPSGEKEDGDYPLPEKGTPQQIGSAITYGRRYCLCAVTGVAPGGDDDDGHAAQKAEHARPRYAHTDAAHERLVPGQSAEDRANGKKAERVRGQAPDDEWTTPVETDREWYAGVEAEIQKFTTDDYGEVLRRRVLEKVQALGCTKEDGEKLRTLIRARRQALTVEREGEPSDA